MVIHVVAPGESIFSIAMEYGVAMSQILNDNQLPTPGQLAIGQTLVIQLPQQVHTVAPGETLTRIAQRYGLTLRQLYRNNPVLEGEETLYPGQTLVISYQQEKEGTLSVSGYAYPFISHGLLRETVPYCTHVIPFTYGITDTGGLVDLNDWAIIDLAKAGGSGAYMHLSTLTEEGNFSNELAHLVLQSQELQAVLLGNIQHTLEQRGYEGLDVDFEFIFPEDRQAYAAFIARLSQQLNPLGYQVIAALAPKTSATQSGLLYEGHDYRLIGKAANEVLLMTYEWGYTYGPPMAVAPVPNVRAVVEYALTELRAEQVWLGVPNYGYDWTLPFVRGQSRATSISNQYAVSLALRYGATIGYDDTAQAPNFQYIAEDGVTHQVWFEDARSIRAKLALIPEYGLLGAGYWNLMRPFPQNWRVLNALYEIREA